MKYILTEQQYILKETESKSASRFILTEEADPNKYPAAKAILQKLNSESYADENIDKTIASLSGNITSSDLLKKLQDASKQVTNFSKKGSWDNVKSAITTYLSLFSAQFGQEAIKQFPKVDSTLTTIKAVLNQPVTDAAQQANLMTAFTAFDEAAKSSAETLAMKATTAAKDNQDDINNISGTLNSLKTKFSKVKEFLNGNDANTIEENDSTELAEVLNAFNEDLPETFPTISANASEQEINQFETDINSIDASCDDLLINFANNAEIQNTGMTDENGNELTASKDWKKLLLSKQPNERAAVWEQYFKVEWGNLADKVKALGPVFKEDCLNDLGFDGVKNPFINFFKKNLGTFKISELTYNALHNALLIDKTLKVQDLKKDGDRFKEFTIVLNPNLYTKSGSEVEEYLRLQNRAYELAESGKFRQDTAQAKNVYNRSTKDKYTYVTQPDKFIRDLFDANCKFFEEQPTPGVENCQLRSLRDINTYLEICFGESATAKTKPLTKDELTKLVKDTKKENCDEMIKYLLVRYGADPAIDDISKVVADAGITDKSSIEFPFTKLKDYNNIFKNKTLTKDDLVALLKELEAKKKGTA